MYGYIRGLYLKVSPSSGTRFPRTTTCSVLPLPQFRMPLALLLPLLFRPPPLVWSACARVVGVSEVLREGGATQPGMLGNGYIPVMWSIDLHPKQLVGGSAVPTLFSDEMVRLHFWCRREDREGGSEYRFQMVL
jgi:hypothetical protein